MILNVLHSGWLADPAVTEVWAILLDEASTSSRPPRSTRGVTAVAGTRCTGMLSTSSPPATVNR
jgi:hypothetical protein